VDSMLTLMEDQVQAANDDTQTVGYINDEISKAPSKQNGVSETWAANEANETTLRQSG
jgi:hypothetical protein